MTHNPKDSPKNLSPIDNSAESSAFQPEQEEEKSPFYPLDDWPKSFDGIELTTFTNYALARMLSGIFLGNFAIGIISIIFITLYKQSLAESVLAGLVSGPIFASIGIVFSAHYSIRLPSTICFLLGTVPNEKVLRAISGGMGCLLISVMMLLAHAFSNYPSDNSAAIFFIMALIAGPLFGLYGSKKETPKIGKKAKILFPLFFGFGTFGLFFLASAIVYAPWYFLLLTSSVTVSTLLVLGIDWIGKRLIKIVDVGG